MQSDDERLEAFSEKGSESSSVSYASDSASSTGTVSQHGRAEGPLSISNVHSEPVIRQALPGDLTQSVQDGASEHFMEKLAKELFLANQSRHIPLGQATANVCRAT